MLPPLLEKKLDKLDTELLSFANELQQYSHEQLNKKANDGGWSAMQCVAHLKLSEQGTIAYIEKKLSFSPELPNKSAVDSWRRMLLLGYLKSPIKFKAPKGIGTAFLPENSELEASLDEWTKYRKQLRQTLRDIDSKYLNKMVFKHPLAGRISIPTTLDFLIAHLQRHRRQALRVLKQA